MKQEFGPAELMSRVKIEKAPRRKYERLDMFKDRSFNRILVDGEHVGFLAMEPGWGKPWYTMTIDEKSTNRCYVKGGKEACKAIILERFLAGELYNAAELERRNQVEAERKAERDRKAAEWEAGRAQRAAERQAQKEADEKRALDAVAVLEICLAGASPDYHPALNLAIASIKKVYEV